MFGYMVLLQILQVHFSSLLKNDIDASQYSGSDIMIAKFPLSLPYPVNFNGYERVNGEFECNGETFKLVKQNHVNDTLYVVFIKDKKGSAINKTFNDFAKNNTSEPLSKSASRLIDSLAKQFLTDTTQLHSLCDGWQKTLSFIITNPCMDYRAQSVSTPPPWA
jgi:hypothetical protein